MVVTAEPIRVLHLIKGLGSGGAERLLVNAAAVRDRDRTSYEVMYLLAHKTALVDAVESHGVPVACLAATGERDLAWARRLRRRLVDRPVEVVHVHSPYVAGVVRAAVRTLPHRCRPALVTTEHNVWSSHTPATRALNAATFALDDAHVAVSADVAASIPRLLRRRVEVLVHGIELPDRSAYAADRARIRAELGVGGHEVVVGVVANYRAQKRVDVMMQVARALLERRLPVRFVSLGQGPLEADLRRLHAELGLGEGFALLGYRADVLPYLAAFDVFAMSSSHEGLPVAAMEAMAMGLPIVATAAGGLASAVRDGVDGRLAPVDRPDELVDALAEVVTDAAQRRRLSCAASARSREYDIRRAVRRLEDIYAHVTARQGVPAPRP